MTELVEVGRGGFGVVYRAHDQRFGRAVAVKIIRDVGLGRDVVARFERECLALGSLSGHPNIVSVYDSGVSDDGDHYLVMEYLGGGSLADRLSTQGTVAAADVVLWGGALAGALETAHRAGIVHRDVKPENALFSEYGALKLVDFGIARIRTAYETRSGYVTATLNHAAPEVVAGAPVTPAADIYSLASVLFTLLWGRPPFDGGDHEETLLPLLSRIVTAPPPDLRTRGVPDALALVIERGLAKAPAERYASAAEFGRALQRAGRSMGTDEVEVPVGSDGQVARAAAVIGEVTDRMPRGKDDTTVRAPALPAGVPEPLPLPAVPTTPGRQRRSGRRIAVAAAATVVLVGGGAAAIAAWPDGSDRPRATAPSSSNPSTSAPVAPVADLTVSDPTVTTAGVEVRQSYTIGTDHTVRSSIRLTNTTGSPITRYWAEAVPEQLARDVGAVTFTPKPAQIVQRDPVVLWKVQILPGASRQLGWSTPLPAAGAPTRDYLIQVATWHAAAVDAATDRITRVLRSLTRTSGTPGGFNPGADQGSTTPGGGGIATGGGPITGGTTPAGGGGTGTPTGTTTTTPNRWPVIAAIAARTDDELASPRVTVGVSDPDGDSVTVRVTGLPSGLQASGSTISGTIAADAAVVTTHADSIGSRTFTVTVSASDTHHHTTTRRFTWTVRDTALSMPNYIGKDGCGPCSDDRMAYDVSWISPPKPDFGCAYDPAGDGNRIFRQSVAPGATIRWGQRLTYWYGKNDTTCTHFATHWP
ncbi:MAG: protein kinase domain-containing protein [Jatrophihabitans sp.]|uniref:serine/threonine-protein kinase n=1 Tax=Jatrophihabitans sp. TaxID=1932789 RepID=UPI003F7FFB47